MKTSSEESRKKIMIIVGAIIVLVICLAVALTTCGSDEKDSREKTDPNKPAVETEASDDEGLTADEKTEKEELEASAEDPAKADADDEKQPDKETAAQSQSNKKPASGSSDSSQSSKPSANTGSSSGSDSGSASKPSTGSSGTSSSSGSSSSSKPSSGSSGLSSTAEKEKVWVVDVPAVYEREPIYEGGYDGYWIKDKNGTVIFQTKDPDEYNETLLLYLSQNKVGTYGSGLPAEIVGYREVCVQEEQGHWEYR